MIRPARHVDQPAIEGLIRRQHKASRLADLVGISDKALDQLLTQLVAAQNQTSVGATFAQVAERGGKIVGFLGGVLQRVYFIGDKLEAGDLFLVSEGAASDTLKLVNSYIAWGKGNRMVLDIKLSWSDTIPGAEKIVALFERKGFTKCGETFRIRKGGK